jgi:hypothetical protein
MARFANLCQLLFELITLKIDKSVVHPPSEWQLFDAPQISQSNSSVSVA